MQKEDRQALLEALRKHGARRDIPNISEETADFLRFMIWLKKARRILEIGSANGYSTIHLADESEAFDGHVTSFEISEVQHKEALKNFKKAGLQDRITLHLGDFTEEAVIGQMMPEDNEKLKMKNGKWGKYDLIFIDAQKADYHVYWQLVKPMMHEQTLVVFDDVIEFREKCQMLYDIMATEEDYLYHIVQTDEKDGVMLVQERGGGNEELRMEEPCCFWNRP